MSEDTTNPELENEEITALQAECDAKGIKYHHKAGVDKLKAALAEAVEAPKEAPKWEPEGVKGVDYPDPAVALATPVKTKAQTRSELHKEMNKLVRIRITCMNPNKRDWSGEIFTVGNSVIGTFKKFVPYGHDFHVPQIILNMIQERKCQVFENSQDEGGNTVRKGRLVKEFGIEILDPITNEELANIRERKIAAGVA